jgi:hypothetical protein
VTKLIYKYLSANFILNLGKIVPAWKANQPYYYEVDNLIEELSQVFCLTKKQLKYYIKGWALKQNRNFDFNEWWCPAKEDIDVFGKLTFPIVRQVFSRILGNDLVAVQPLEMPRGLLHYMDYQSGVSNRNEVIQNRPIGEIDHEQGTTIHHWLEDWRTRIRNQQQRQLIDIIHNHFHDDRINLLYRNQLAHLRPLR